MRPDGTSARQITDSPGGTVSPGGLRTAARSPSRPTTVTGAFQVWLMAADGAGARAITRGGDWQQPFWSPDGRRLAVSAKVDAPHFRIVIINREGGRARLIQQPAEVDNVHPAWSPDGRSIVFTSGKGETGACGNSPSVDARHRRRSASGRLPLILCLP